MLTSLHTPAGSTWIVILICTLFAIVFWLAGVGDRVSAYGLPIAGVVLPLLAAGLHIGMLAIANIGSAGCGAALFGLLLLALCSYWNLQASEWTEPECLEI